MRPALRPGAPPRLGLLLCAAFLAACPFATAWAALRVAVISDLNGSYGSARYEAAVGEAVGALLKLHPDLVISTGDMVAGQRLHPPLPANRLEAMWAAFHRTVTDPLQAAGIPLAVTPGNHDASGYAAFQGERDLYRREWQGRGTGLQMVAGDGYPFDYAFSASDVLFVSLDVTRVGRLPAAQLQWLDRLLATHGPRFRHRVVFSHLPIYPFTYGREQEVSADTDLERILARHRVELYLTGHHHAFYPGFHGGVRHVGQACLGAGPRRLLGAAAPAPRAVTWLVFAEGSVSVAALTGPTLTERVDIRRLPPAIRSRYGTLVRDDLRHAPAATKPAAPGDR